MLAIVIAIAATACRVGGEAAEPVSASASSSPASPAALPAPLRPALVSVPATSGPSISPLRPLPVSSAAATVPGGPVPLYLEGVTTVPPGSAFEVVVRARLPEARLLLLDLQQASVPASGTTEIADESRFTVIPTAPLRAGASYELRLEGLASRALVDADGRAYAPASFRLRADGDPPPPAAKRKPAKRRKGSGSPRPEEPVPAARGDGPVRDAPAVGGLDADGPSRDSR